MATPTATPSSHSTWCAATPACARCSSAAMAEPPGSVADPNQLGVRDEGRARARAPAGVCGDPQIHLATGQVGCLQNRQRVLALRRAAAPAHGALVGARADVGVDAGETSELVGDGRRVATYGLHVHVAEMVFGP